MAVTIKKKELTLVSLAKRILDNPDMVKLAKAIEAGGYKLVTEAALIKVENASACLAHSPVKLSAIESCLKGNLSYTGKKVLQEHIEAFIKKAYNLMPEVSEQVNLNDIYDQTMAAYHKNGGGNKVAAIKTYRTLSGASLKEAKDKVEAWIDAEQEAAGPLPTTDEEVVVETDDGTKLHYNLDSGKMHFTTPEVAKVTDEPVPLHTATKLMQPVTGTSGGSVYNVIALGADAKVAVRIKKDNDVAIRVWPMTDHGKKACSTAGLDSKSGGHWSLHLHPGEKALVGKSVGAVLFGMGLDWDGIIGDMQNLVGVGK
jgi:hypothetical protein